MPLQSQPELIRQLDALLASYKNAESATQRRGGDYDSSEVHRLITQARAAIIRVAGSGSPYAQQAESILSRSAWDSSKLAYVMGVVQALRSDLEAGYLRTVEELIHADLFGDFLEMATYLLEEGFKDAAAVIAGASLEGHLRQLAKRHEVPTETSDSNPRPKKADALNADLSRALAYSGLDQKNVTAWLGLRNKAAHGLYTEYTAEQVAIALAGIRDFITRNPA